MRTVIISTFLWVLSSVSAFGKYYEATHYDVHLQLEPAGVLAVTETVDFRFVAGPFQFVFRDIAATETDGIRDVEASLDGQPCAAGTGPGQVEISGTSPVQVRWHFAPLMEGSHTFTVSYRAAGVIRPGSDAQTLRWRALPQERSYRIGSSNITLEYPAGIQPIAVALLPYNTQFALSPGRAVATLVNGDLHADVIVRARFPLGSFSSSPPEWLAINARKNRDRQQGTRAGTIGALVLAAVAFLWMFRVRSSAAAATEVPVIAGSITSPPAELPPALAALLGGRPASGLGTLFDLARRGVLRIEETKPKYKTVRQFQVVRSGSSANLAPHEQGLLERAFPQGETAVEISRFFTRGRPRFMATVRAEAAAAGLVDPVRAQVRSRFFIAGLCADAAGTLILVMGLVLGPSPEFGFAGAVAVPVGIALLGIGIVALILGGTQSVWSSSGLLASSQWKAFANYLFQASRGRLDLPPASGLERLLPYAAAFGVAEPLLVRQKMRDGIALPPWFQAVKNAQGADSDAFVAFVSTSSSSGSFDGGGGGGGDGGASGGGSSGAG